MCRAVPGRREQPSLARDFGDGSVPDDRNAEEFVRAALRGQCLAQAVPATAPGAVHGLQYRITGRIEILADQEPEPGSPALPDVRLVYRVEVYKDWDFDKGQSEYGVSFAPLARLHEVGLARVRGHGTQRRPGVDVERAGGSARGHRWSGEPDVAELRYP
jgi:hypothetical protein